MLQPLIKAVSSAFTAVVLTVLLSTLLAGHVSAGGASADLRPDAPLISEILRQADGTSSPGDRIVAISGRFRNTPYAANRLVGGPDETERLVLDLDGFDCFTFLDAVEALRRSSTVDDFPVQLVQVRYKTGAVSYANRRHFFSDWVSEPGSPVKDVTARIGQGREVHVDKLLNQGEGGELLLKGIDVTPRRITYLPAGELDEELLAALEPGDYVGIFSTRPGLDVSHTGLIVKNGAAIMFRHASSRAGMERVIDEELITYLHDKAGLVIYRVAP